MFRNIVVGRMGRRLFCLPVGLFGGREDGGIDCQLHHHVCFDWREALRLGLLSLTQQMFHGEKMGVSTLFLSRQMGNSNCLLS